MPAEPRSVSPRAGVIVLEGKPPRLVRLRDAQVITPAFEAAGNTVDDVWLVSAPERSRAIALGRGKTREKLVGLPDAELTTFRFQPTPFDAQGDHFGAGGLVGADSGVVMPIFEDRSKEPREAARWVDLRAPRLPGGGAKAREVVLLDFDKGSREVVARVDDCPGGLGELADADGRGLAFRSERLAVPPPGSRERQRVSR